VTGVKLPDSAPPPLTREFIRLAPDVAAAVLQTLQAGWEDACQAPDIQPSAEEVPLTERLRDSMRGVLNAGKLPWGKALAILPGTESRSTLEQPRPDGVTDLPILVIEIFLRLGEHDPHAIVECKRIDGSDSGLCRRYVLEGIDRFKSGRYASNHAMGFMAGYVIAGDEEQAADGINSFLVRRSREGEQLKESELIDEKCFRQSQHQRSTSRSPIDLHHALLLVKRRAR
jgi:hypothetical protein